jgi:drug/metabolite transporter (DMT)-like permease
VDAELLAGSILLPLVSGLVATLAIGPRRIGWWLAASVAGLVGALLVNTAANHLFVTIGGALAGALLFLGAAALIRRVPQRA